MGLASIVRAIFGGDGGNIVRDTVEVFRPNAEKEAQRTADYQAASLQQFGKEFAHARKGWFDRFIDGLNRLPRPFMAVGVLALFVAAMFDPIWFAERMVGVALIPEPMWWLLGAIVSFYFGARHQAKGQSFQASIARTISAGAALKSLKEVPDDAPEAHTTPKTADTHTDADLEAATLKVDTDGNAALEDWRATR